MNAIRIEAVVELDGVLHITNYRQRGDAWRPVIVLHRETREREGDAARRRFLDMHGGRISVPQAPIPR